MGVAVADGFANECRQCKRSFTRLFRLTKRTSLFPHLIFRTGVDSETSLAETETEVGQKTDSGPAQHEGDEPGQNQNERGSNHNKLLPASL